MKNREISRTRPVLFRLLALFLGVLCAVVLGESAARLLPPAVGVAGEELEWLHWDIDHARRLLVVDNQMGFRPLLKSELNSEDALYSRFGTALNSYPSQKRPGIERVLFMGDSVTFRGHIVAALQDLYGCEKYEYWNAGVDSFNTFQEVELYRRYNYLLDPDRVVLTFHVNDFQITPIAFVGSDGQLHVVAPAKPLSNLDRLLGRHSQLFRDYLAYRLRGEQPSIEAAANEFRRALDQLTTLLPSDCSLTVLVFPHLAKWEEWSPRDRRARRTALTELKARNIRHFDLAPLLFRELEAGRNVQETPGDHWHCNTEFARKIAVYLFKEGLF